MAGRHRLLTFVNGVELGHLRADLTTSELDARVTDLVMSQPMSLLEDGAIRCIICNTTTPLEEVATWLSIHSKQKGGLADGNNRSGNVEEINLVEIKKHIDLGYQMDQLRKERKKKEIKERVEKEVGQMTSEQKEDLRKVFRGEDIDE